FLYAAVTQEAQGLALNVGGGEPVSLQALAKAIIAANGGGRYDIREFPPERKRIDIGDFLTDDSRFRGLSGWCPRVGLAEGLRRRVEYYREIWAAYLSQPQAINRAPRRNPADRSPRGILGAASCDRCRYSPRPRGRVLHPWAGGRGVRGRLRRFYRRRACRRLRQWDGCDRARVAGLRHRLGPRRFPRLPSPPPLRPAHP